MTPFNFPPAGFGPGSQPDPEGELQYMPMPSGMRTYSLHIPEAGEGLPEALALLAEISAACTIAAQGGPNASFDLATLSAPARSIVADALGSGEVSMKLRGVPAILIQESVFAGVWMLAASGIDKVEVGPIPAQALSRAHIPHKPAVGTLAARKPGLANGPSILAELIDRSRTHRSGALNTVNLTLLPHTPEDLDYLAEALGEGALTLLSRGYGNCRITALALPHLWRVQFYNSMDTLILDTFEITDLPETALAAAEDLADSATRILDVIEVLQ